MSGQPPNPPLSPAPAADAPGHSFMGGPPTPTAGSMTHTRDGRPRVLPPEFVARRARVEAHMVTTEMIELYLEHLGNTGLHYRSASTSRLSYHWIKRLRADEDFVRWEEEAMEKYRDSIVEEAHRRAVFGVDEPIIGGKDKDQIITTVRRYSDRLMEILLKRHIPEFREKWEGEVKVTGGVLVAPVAPANVADWIARHSGQSLPDAGSGSIVPALPGQQPSHPA